MIESELPGREVARYIVMHRGIASARDTGQTMLYEPFGGWKPFRRKKDHVMIEDWKDDLSKRLIAMPKWATDVDYLPTEDDLKDAVSDGVCATPSGDDVEPDGHGPDGAPSWLMVFGLI